MIPQRSSDLGWSLVGELWKDSRAQRVRDTRNLPLVKPNNIEVDVFGVLTSIAEWHITNSTQEWQGNDTVICIPVGFSVIKWSLHVIINLDIVTHDGLLAVRLSGEGRSISVKHQWTLGRDESKQTGVKGRCDDIWVNRRAQPASRGS